MSAFRRFVSRSARLRALGRGVRDAIRGPAAGTAASRPRASASAAAAAAERDVPDAGAGVAELHRVAPRPGVAGRRLNLLLPTLEPNRTFGGARTALDLFEALAPGFARRRIVAFHPVSEAALGTLDGYTLAGATDGDADVSTERLVVAAPRREEASLAVGREDAFLATFWTTAELAIRLARWQAATFDRPVRPFAYLVQDFEPGFYPWSAQSELARNAYAGAVPTIGVVNSGSLADYLAVEGVAFERQYTFEPRLATGLRPLVDEPPRERERRIVVYGRPDTPRNAFPLIVDGLRAWAEGDPDAASWSVVSAGRSHAPVELGGGLVMRSVGKLDLADYGVLLRTSAVGLSLMVSPHPSYPPLDMAHLGLLVLTNRFRTKDLAAWHENIANVATLDRDGIAVGLHERTARFEADPEAGDRGRPLRDDYLASGPLFPFAAELAGLLAEGRRPPADTPRRRRRSPAATRTAPTMRG